MSQAEDAMEAQNYEQAWANIDSVLAQDSANVDAYLMRAQVLRQMADSTMAPDEYKSYFERARQAEEKAIKFDPGSRSDVRGQRRLAYAQQTQSGARAFRSARQTEDATASYRQAAAFFGGASATYPDSANVILNEAYALLNMAQSQEDGDMTKAIPVLQRYLETTDEPNKSAYDILSAIYSQNGETEKAIELLETARADLSQRPTYFKIGGNAGLKYSGSVTTNGSSREVSGTAPGRVPIDASGDVSGTFEKAQEKGQLRVQLFYKGTAVRDTTIQKGRATLSADLSEEAPLAQIEGRLLNAYNRAGQTEKAMEAYREQIQDNPNNVTYRYNYGSMLLQADRFDEAIEQLTKTVELEPGNVKAQYNLGAAYSNKARILQDSINTLNDSLKSISQEAVDENREPTAEEKEKVDELDSQITELNEQKKDLFRQAIPPLERARQMSGPDGDFRQDACSALVTAYVQIEQVQKAQEYEQCAGLQMQGGGNGNGGSN